MQRTRRKLSSLVLVVLTTLLCSCAHNVATLETSRGVVKDWNGIDEVELLAPFNLHDYSQVVIAKLDTSATPLPPVDDNTFQPVSTVLKSSSELFTGALREEAKPPLQVVGPVDSLPTTTGTLLIKGKVSKMDPGSQALRYWVGFGAGKTVVEVTGEVIDASTNKPLLRFKHAKASGIGVFGGEYTKFLSDDIQDVGKDIGALLQNFDRTTTR